MDAELHTLTLADIARNCALETERFFQRLSHDPRFCFELFRRAIADRNQRAWSLLTAQYRALVLRWIRRHPAFATCGEDAEYLANRSFEKLWAHLGPERFNQFTDLASLLRYLQMCAHSSIVDETRAHGAPTVELEETTRAYAAPEASIETRALDDAQRHEFWNWLNTRLHDERERRVVYGSFVLALKPRAVYEMYRDTFRNVDDVYSVKQNVLERLRRDPDLKAML